MKPHRLELCFACLGSWLAACHGSGIGPGGGAGPFGGSANAKDFCHSYVQTIADFQAKCLGGDLAFWSRSYAARMNCDLVAEAVSAGRIAYDPDAGAGCLQHLNQLGCDQAGVEQSLCGALVGKIPSGGACSFDSRLSAVCAPGNNCIGDHACGGTCTPYKTLQLGDPCMPIGADSAFCANHQVCQNNTYRCVADVEEGQPCKGPTAGDCAYPLYCEGGTNSTTGICIMKKTSGACDPAGVPCAYGYSCKGTPGAETCTKWKWPGDTCTRGLGECTYSWCGNEGKCTDDPVQEGQSCSPFPGEHAPCASGLTCQFGADSETCQKLKAAGSACNFNGECAGSGSYCDSKSKVCVACS